MAGKEAAQVDMEEQAGAGEEARAELAYLGTSSRAVSSGNTSLTST